MVDEPHPAVEPLSGKRNWGRWITVVQLGLLSMALALSAYVAIQAFKPKPVAPAVRFAPDRFGAGRGARGQFMRGMPQQDRKIVKDFDKNGDQRLDRAERSAAREWLRTQGNASFDRFGGRGRTANPEAGIHLKPSDVRSYPAAPLYDTAILRTIFLTFEMGTGPRSLPRSTGPMSRSPPPWSSTARPTADVGVHFRGNSSYRSVPPGAQAFAEPVVRLRASAPGDRRLPDAQPAELERRRDVRPHGPVQRDRAALLAIARTNYVRVVINGESWGVYVNVQQFNKDFLPRLVQAVQGSAVEGARQPARTRRPRVSRR